jgi:hypothetical protein
VGSSRASSRCVKNRQGIVFARLHDLRCEVSFCNGACYVYVVYCRARANGGVKEPRIGSQFKMLACSHLCSHCIGVMFGRGAKASHSSIGRCQRM